MQQILPRELLNSRRATIREEFVASKDGLKAARAMTDAAEEAIGHLYARALAKRPIEEREIIESSFALVAIGGFARCELAPFSDIDLLLLHADKAKPPVHALIRELVRDIWDAGLHLGHNVGSPKELVQLATKEVLPATSFLDARILIGPEKLFDNFRKKFRTYLRGGKGIELFVKVVDAVRDEQAKYGATIHLLEPNVKKTIGGLRDIHLIRWATNAIYETTDLVELESRGIIGTGDAAALATALDYFLRLRCDLHFHSDKAHDDLLRTDQVRLAKEWGYEDTPGRRAVELFMANYFQHSTAVADSAERFIERTRPRTLMANARELFLTRRAAEGVWIGPDRLILSAKRRRQVAGSIEEILELAELATRHRVKFDYHLTEALRRQHLFRPEATDKDPELSPEAAQLFLRFLQTPGTQHQVLRILHRVGVLSLIIPEFEHARCLLQFNAYHKYTVDEHTFVVLEHLESFATRDDVIGRAYAGVERKDILHLAVLLHDLGKGFEIDHSELGKEIALRAAARLKLSEDETETLVFLVHRHLMLSDLAMKRDISDPKVWVSLGKEVGDSQRLRMLYVLTCADVMGVGPGVYTPWTGDLLEELYRNTLSLFGDEKDARNSAELWERRRLELLDKHRSNPRMSRLIEGLSSSYLAEVAPAEIEEHLAVASKLDNGDIDVITKYRPETKTTTYTVVTSERAAEYPFSKICGGLAAHHMDVLSARIYTLGDGVVIDQFDVRDTHCFGEPSRDRVHKVEMTIRRILKGELSVQDALYSTRSSLFTAKPRVMAPINTRVTIDNSCSENCTVIDIFANNRRGLLYTLAKGIARLGLSVQYAKIATYEDEAADVFYVRELDGRKALRADRVKMIEDHLTADVRRLVEDPRAMGF